MMKLIIIWFPIICGAIWLLYKSFIGTKLPQLDTEECWGKKQKGKEDTSIRPFQIEFNADMIKELKNRLNNYRASSPPLQGIGFTYGFNINQLDNWSRYWAEEYPFSERERFLNKFPQFKTNIQGLDIHFIRVRPELSTGVQIVPLLIMHGWPGSTREFYEAIPILTSPTPGYDFVFEVIVPSLPGFGFSDASVKPGLAAPQAAVIFRNLMRRLGHKRFYVQGGDWGSVIASAMATLYPDDVLGLHSNFLISRHTCSIMRTAIGSFIPSLVVDKDLADRMYPLSSIFTRVLRDYAYFGIQATKPDSVGVALSDSPVGFLAYFLDRFAVGTGRSIKEREDGGLTTYYKKEQLIDNLMMYWISNSITSSMRFFAENMSQKVLELKLDSYSSPVPTWALQAKYEILYQSPNVLRLKYPNLINTTVLDDGGHHIALEMPQVFADDVFKAIDAFRGWHKGMRTENSEL